MFPRRFACRRFGERFAGKVSPVAIRLKLLKYKAELRKIRVTGGQCVARAGPDWRAGTNGNRGLIWR
jgi:hypothetical protein